MARSILLQDLIYNFLAAHVIFLIQIKKYLLGCTKYNFFTYQDDDVHSYKNVLFWWVRHEDCVVAKFMMSKATK